jgi:molybdate transport system permease protein
VEAAWIALGLSLKVALWATALDLVLGVAAGFALARLRFPGRELVDSILLLPMVLPPTVLGYYLLVALGGQSPVGQLYAGLVGHPLAFSFAGLLVASVIFNIPFAWIPTQRAFEAIPADLYDAARSCGLSRWRTLWRIELPLAWRGILSGLIMTVAHTLGEFGVVLMVGGSIPGETKTVAISIYDRVQAFDLQAAGSMSAILLAASLATLLATVWLTRTRPSVRRP